jgi:hypothetical protein
MQKFFFKNVLRPLVKRINSRHSASIPKHELRPMHVSNARLLTSREELLELLPKNGVVAELGVDEGHFSKKIFTINKPKKLHLIDFWGSKRFNQKKKAGVENLFAEEISTKTVEINLGLSTTVVYQFNAEYFDWIYIDTTHAYQLTIDELEAYRSKIKKGGIIAGHDYIVGNWNGVVRYGVIEAVHEFCVRHNWEILYITTELNNHPSFAIREILTDKF